MSFSILDGHAAIGWDFDNTLIGHAKSQAIHEYIRAHPEKRHVIVTFEHARAHDAIRIIEGAVLITDVTSYIEWKGEMCRRHGLTVLVDDMRDQVLAGCAKHGIFHIHPDDL
jgi:hypothetical protein